MPANPISSDKIKQLLAQPARGGTRTPKDPTEPRDLQNWWKQGARFGNCDNPDCIDPRPHKVVEGNTMVSVVGDVKMCRPCFLAGYKSLATPFDPTKVQQ